MKPTLSKPQVSLSQYNNKEGTGELKHLSSRRKRKQHVILCSGERKRAQTGCMHPEFDRIIDSTNLAERFGKAARG